MRKKRKKGMGKLFGVALKGALHLSMAATSKSL